MGLRVATTTVLLTLFIQCVEGVIVVNKSGDHDDRIVCCTYGNCSCTSLYSALVNLTSNVLINITTDVELSSNISLVNFTNITIAGHNNPTVSCNNSRGIHFVSCYNCTIEGITWKRYGFRNDRNVYPVLQLFNSSNLTIRNCSFQYSRGQSVVLLGVSGDVNIEHCNFSHNTLYEGHGAAVYYSSSNTSTAGSALKFVINSCNFYHIKSTQSIVYFGQPSARISECLYLQNSKFHYNKGVPIYVSNQNLNLNGEVEFYGNIAENRGGIAISDHSNVTFHKSATINFTNNSAMHSGGAVYLINNSSTCGAIRINFGSQLESNHNSTINFSFNSAFNGGALCVHENSTVTFEENSTVTFYHNRAHVSGDAIHA